MMRRHFRPRLTDEADIARIRELRRSGMSVRKIVAEMRFVYSIGQVERQLYTVVKKRDRAAGHARRKEAVFTNDTPPDDYVPSHLRRLQFDAKEHFRSRHYEGNFEL